MDNIGDDTRLIPLEPGVSALIDARDQQIVEDCGHKWRVYRGEGSGATYAASAASPTAGYPYGRFTFMHRLILEPTSERVVHHRNGNGLDNRRCNLIALTQAEHQRLHECGWRGEERDAAGRLTPFGVARYGLESVSAPRFQETPERPGPILWTAAPVVRIEVIVVVAAAILILLALALIVAALI